MHGGCKSDRDQSFLSTGHRARTVKKEQYQQGIGVIPKSVREERMVENLNIWDFELTREDIDAIATLNTGKSVFVDHRDPETADWLTNCYASSGVLV